MQWSRNGDDHVLDVGSAVCWVVRGFVPGTRYRQYAWRVVRDQEVIATGFASTQKRARCDAYHAAVKTADVQR